MIGTGSTGNCYYVERSGVAFLIECGIRYADVLRHLGDKMRKVQFILVTHEHGDHIKYANDFIKRGYKLYMSKGTAEGASLPLHMINIIESGVVESIGTVNVMPFDLQHDVNEPTGFMIDVGGKRLVFATDTYYIKYKFPGVTHYVIECNYDDETINSNLNSGYLNRFLYNRVIRSHMSLRALLSFFDANDLSKVEEIHLIHASSSNGNRPLILDSVRRKTGKLTMIH